MLIVEDDAGVRTLVRALIALRGLPLDVALDGDQAVAKLRRQSYSAVILDLMVPGRNGFEILQFLKAERPETLKRVIVMTAASERTLRDFDASQIHSLLHKPFDIVDLLLAVDDCCGSEQ